MVRTTAGFIEPDTRPPAYLSMLLSPLFSASSSYDYVLRPDDDQNISSMSSPHISQKTNSPVDISLKHIYKHTSNIHASSLIFIHPFYALHYNKPPTPHTVSYEVTDPLYNMVTTNPTPHTVAYEGTPTPHTVAYEVTDPLYSIVASPMARALTLPARWSSTRTTPARLELHRPVQVSTAVCNRIDFCPFVEV